MKRVLGGDREYHGREVLSPPELAQDAGWLPQDRLDPTVDPSLVDAVVALQGRRAS